MGLLDEKLHPPGALGIGHWALGIGHWAWGIGNVAWGMGHGKEATNALYLSTRGCANGLPRLVLHRGICTEIPSK